MDQKQIKELLKQGWLRIKIIQEVAGFPKEHIEKALELINKKIDENENIIVIDRKVNASKKVGEKTWSTFADSELLVDSFNTLMYVTFEYMPSSIEVIEPETITNDAQHITDLMNEIIASLHGYDSALKQTMAMRAILEKKLKALGVDDPWKEYKKK